MRPFLAVTGWILMIVSALLSALIFIPAPNMLLWMMSLAAGEWSLWLVPMSALGALLTLRSPSHSIWLRFLPVFLLLVTTLAALTPSIAAFRTAAREDADLSIGEYLFGAQESEVDLTPGIAYHGLGTDTLRFDLYRPADGTDDGSGTLPAAVVIHGGSWRGGERSELTSFDRWLAGTGRVVFDIDYHLAGPDARFPVQLDDVMTALTWLRQNAHRYRVDTSNVIIVGRSAGGELALLAAGEANRMLRNVPPTFSANGDTVGGAPARALPVRIRAAIAYYAPTDLVWGYEAPPLPDIIHSREVLETYLGGSPSARRGAYDSASPTVTIDSTMPPTLLIHGGRDRIVDPGHLFRADSALARHGVPHRSLFLPWADHGFDVHAGGFASQIAHRAILDFLDQHAKEN